MDSLYLGWLASLFALNLHDQRKAKLGNQQQSQRLNF